MTTRDPIEDENRILAALPDRTIGENRYPGPMTVILRGGQSRPHIGAMNLNLTDAEAAPLTQELHHIVESDRYPFSPRIGALKAILVSSGRSRPARLCRC
jgi:hypothetical protein